MAVDLLVDIADIIAEPVSGSVSIRPAGGATLYRADGQIIAAVNATETLGTGGTPTTALFPGVPASNDPTLRADSRGYALEVTATLKRAGRPLGNITPQTLTWIVLVEGSGTVELSALAQVEFAPPGPPALDAGHAMDASANRRGLTPFLRAVGGGEARIVVMGDSNSEGLFLSTWDQRWMNVLRDRLRTRWGLTGDTGQGYLPATYNTLGATPPKPARGGAAGNTLPITNLGGLGLRSMWMKGDGTVTWPALTFSATTPLRVLINRRPLHGSIEILVDGTVKATVATGGSDAIIAQDITVTAGTHVISARGQGGSTVQIAGIEHRTGQGVAVYDGALSGATVKTFTNPSAGQALHWSEVARVDPHLIIVALGANDMAPNQSYSLTPQEWEDGLRQIVALRDEHAPDAGLLLLHAAAPANDPDGSARLRRYEAHARAALEDAPRASILYLSSLWQPRPDHVYSLANTDPDGWLSDGVHMTAAAHSQVADLILGALAANMPAAKGDPPTSMPWANVTGKPSTFTPTAHAATHATGGSDPITPASIRALPSSLPYYTGHLDDAPVGTVRLGAYDLPGLPPQAGAYEVGFLTTYKPTDGHIVQMYVSHSYGGTYTRTSAGGAAPWQPWRRLITDDDPRLPRTGTGSPEGVVAAPVGTVYTDKAVTAGAVEWTKWSGTGTTGWRVTKGDTGFRNIAGLLVNGWTASSVRIARTPYQVTLLIEGLSAANATSGAALSGLPQGWGSVAVARSSLHTTASVFRSCYLASDLAVSNYAPGDVLYGTVVGPASTTWPTSLIGT